MSGVRAVVALSLALAGFAACQKSSLQPDRPDGPGGVRPFPDGGPGSSGAAGTTGAFDGGFTGVGGAFGNGGAGGGGGAIGIFGPSECVVTSLQLPWMTVPGSLTRFEVVTSGDAIAVLNRQASQLDLRTYRRDGTVLGGRQFAPDVQVLAHGDDHFLLIAHGVSGDFTATDLPPTLAEGVRVAMTGSTATEKVRAAVKAGGSFILLTTERFVNMTTGVAVPWTTSLGLDAAAAFTSGGVYGVTQRGGEILVAGGSGSSLGLMVLDAEGNVVRSGVDTQALGSLAAETTTTLPIEGGLLMFDGNPPRFTQIGFDLSRVALGANMWLATFYRSAPRVVALNMNQPIGVWLTVYPGNDNSQGSTGHDLYGCVFDFTNRTSCAGTFLIARTGISGYDVALAPVAAAGFADLRYFAVAHSDANKRTWLRVADMMCRPGQGLN